MTHDLTLQNQPITCYHSWWANSPFHATSRSWWLSWFCSFWLPTSQPEVWWWYPVTHKKMISKIYAIEINLNYILRDQIYNCTKIFLNIECLSKIYCNLLSYRVLIYNWPYLTWKKTVKYTTAMVVVTNIGCAGMTALSMVSTRANATAPRRPP